MSAVAPFKREGLGYLIKQGIQYCSALPRDYFVYYYLRLSRRYDRFEFQGRRYNYFFHPYGTTLKNERAVEMPLVWDIIKESYMANKKVLEVGNVLSYRFNISHDVLDKYEKKE